MEFSPQKKRTSSLIDEKCRRGRIRCIRFKVMANFRNDGSDSQSIYRWSASFGPHFRIWFHVSLMTSERISQRALADTAENAHRCTVLTFFAILCFINNILLNLEKKLKKNESILSPMWTIFCSSFYKNDYPVHKWGRFNLLDATCVLLHHSIQFPWEMSKGSWHLGDVRM